VASLDNVGDGGTLGPVALDAGDYTVGEDGYGGTILSDYVTFTGGDCAPDGSISLALAEDRTCTIDNGFREAYFLVQKHFTDGNPGTVTVQLTCQTGLPLIQTFDVSETELVNFVLTSYSPGDLNCRVQEISGGTSGYSATYAAGAQYGGAGAIRSEADGCYFDAIQFGQFTCNLTNELEAVDLTVYKQWYGVEVANYLNLDAEADYTCYNVRGGPDSPTETRSGSLHFEGAQDSELVEDLYPDWAGSSHCTVSESRAISAVEVDDGDCADVPLAPGSGNECTIVNTVFFEGIPTLSRDALLVLGLVVLAAGLIGVRRFT